MNFAVFYLFILFYLLLLKTNQSTLINIKFWFKSYYIKYKHKFLNKFREKIKIRYGLKKVYEFTYFEYYVNKWCILFDKVVIIIIMANIYF